MNSVYSVAKNLCALCASVVKYLCALCASVVKYLCGENPPYATIWSPFASKLLLPFSHAHSQSNPTDRPMPKKALPFCDQNGNFAGLPQMARWPRKCFPLPSTAQTSRNPSPGAPGINTVSIHNADSLILRAILLDYSGTRLVLFSTLLVLFRYFTDTLLYNLSANSPRISSRPAPLIARFLILSLGDRCKIPNWSLVIAM